VGEIIMTMIIHWIFNLYKAASIHNVKSSWQVII